MIRRKDSYLCHTALAVASSSRSQLAVRPASAVVCLIWARPSISVREHPLLVVAIVTHLVTQLWASFSLTTWMQTTGASDNRRTTGTAESVNLYEAPLGGVY